MVGQIYPSELQLNRANSSDTEALFLDLNLSITNDIVSSNFFYDKRDDFNFEIVNFPFIEVFLAPLLIVYKFLSLFVLLECALMLMPTTTETYL